MKAPSARKQMRCAVYTRKSTDHNLDLAFNSLDAQREACEAYIKSQAHEGWRLVPDRFDDGAFSGASLNRPALQELIAAIEARRIDVVVVYKVDRLTRSLADFAKLVDIFDAHEVSFVSITQSFNTTSSMGRLTLNVLLSFAQFEREVIGERVRDKIAASKRKGIWVGGPVPLGYRIENKKLQVVAEEAEIVRTIFGLYLKAGSIGALIEALRAQNIRPKGRKLADGRIIVAESFSRGPLGYLLRNRCYVGEVAYRGEIHRGEHEPILDRLLFEAVQARLSEQAATRTRRKSRPGALLKGLIFDDRGNPMSPSHAKKGGVRYRYYISYALLQGRQAEAGSISRIAAPDVEHLVFQALCAGPPAEGAFDADLVRSMIDRVDVHADAIQITPKHPASGRSDGRDYTDVLSIPFRARGVRRKGVTHEPGEAAVIDSKSRDALLMSIARAMSWIEDIEQGRTASFEEVGAREGLAERYVRRLATLAFLSPTIVRRILEGSAPAALTLSRLTDAPPLSWAAQDRVFLS